MRALLCSLLIVLFGASPAWPAQPSSQADLARQISDLELAIADLEIQIEDLELWGEMQYAAQFVPSRESRCWVYLEMAEQTREDLIALNEQYRGRADDEYRRQAEILQSDNRNAVVEYRSCFASVVSQRFPIIRQSGASGYQAFLGRYNVLSDAYQPGDVSARLEEARAELERLRALLAELEGQDASEIGVAVSVFRTVEVFRNGAWTPVERGMRILVSDEIRTGPKGRARIEFDDKIQQTNAGPTVINIGSNALIRLAAYQVRLDNPAQRQGVVDLIRGSIRAFTRRWGPESAFRVRYGASICGIRGTEVAITHNPDTGESAVWVDHGDAFLEADGREFPLNPGEVTTFQDDQITNQRPFDPAEYNQIIQATAERDDMDANEAILERMTARRGVLDNVSQTARGGGSSGFAVGSLNRAGASGDFDREAARLRAMASEARRDIDVWLAAYKRRDWDTVMRHCRHRAGSKCARDSPNSAPKDWRNRIALACLMTGGSIASFARQAINARCFSQSATKPTRIATSRSATPSSRERASAFKTI